MKPARSPRGAAAAPLLHWLVLVSGLSLLTALRFAELDRMVPIWIGSVVGTGVGQLLARRRVRLWLAAFLIGNLAWFLPMVLLAAWVTLGEVAHPWRAIEASLVAFFPAAACGYFSLTERLTAAGFWFPASLWTVCLLEGTSGPSVGGVVGWLLLSALAALFLLTLRAKESRRVALWQAHAAVRLAPQRRRVTLRASPLAPLAGMGATAAVGAAALVLTAWIAPHLWQREKLPGAAETAATPWQPATGGGVCCPDALPAEAPRHRVREYLPFTRARGQRMAPDTPSECVPCGEALAARGDAPTAGHAPGPATDEGDAVAAAPGAPIARAPVAAPALPSATPLQAATTSRPIAAASPIAAAPPIAPEVAPQATAAPPPPLAAAPPPAAPRPAAPPPPSPPLAAAPPPAAPRPAALPPPPPAAPAPAGRSSAPLVAALLAALALHLALRPLRRALVLRHLARPLWQETVDQRVSNLWELMLVGLRDAGFRAVPGEPPQALARRVGLPGMEACAAVLERARHGVRVELGDLAAMEQASRAVYTAARRRAGWAARAASWLRWV